MTTYYLKVNCWKCHADISVKSGRGTATLSDKPTTDWKAFISVTEKKGGAKPLDGSVDPKEDIPWRIVLAPDPSKTLDAKVTTRTWKKKS